MKNPNSTKNNSRLTAQRLLITFICLALSMTIFAAAAFAETAKASDMRLESSSGDVTITNDSEKNVSLREGMKLYSGYCVTTGEDGCAYISLDADKLIKLDANSQVELKKEGGELELFLSAGQLFFNVTKPLEDTESMNIRTSTMVTGIRGTSGFVSILPSDESATSILDGQVELTNIRNGETQSLRAGKTASSIHGEIFTRTMNKRDVPLFVLEEIERDEQLQQKIEEVGVLTVEGLMDMLPNENGIVWMDFPTYIFPEPPASSAPVTSAPATGAPATGAPATSAPATGAPATSAPATGAPATSAPATGAPATGAPATGAPATSTP